MSSKFNAWVDHTDLHHNLTEDRDELYLWGRPHTGLIAIIPIDRTFYADRFIKKYEMKYCYTLDASDGNKYDVYEDRGCHFRVAIPA